MSVKSVVLICGGGNGAHCLAGLASLKSNIESRVLTLYSGRNSNRAASEYGATIRHTCTCMRESLIVTFDCDSVRRHGIAKKNHQLYSIGHIENI